jgi:hypothetical protein
MYYRPYLIYAEPQDTQDQFQRDLHTRVMSEPATSLETASKIRFKRETFVPALLVVQDDNKVDLRVSMLKYPPPSLPKGEGASSPILIQRGTMT